MVEACVVGEFRMERCHRTTCTPHENRYAVVSCEHLDVRADPFDEWCTNEDCMERVDEPLDGEADFEAPDFSSTEKAQVLIGLPFDQLVDEKMIFLTGLKEEWWVEGAENGVYDPRSREGMELKTSYSDE